MIGFQNFKRQVFGKSKNSEREEQAAKQMKETKSGSFVAQQNPMKADGPKMDRSNSNARKSSSGKPERIQPTGYVS
jgi:hypothetical protein